MFAARLDPSPILVRIDGRLRWLARDGRHVAYVAGGEGPDGAPEPVALDLTGASDDDLAAQRTAAEERLVELDAEPPTDDLLNEIEQLVGTLEAIDAEAGRRAGEAEAREQRRQELLSRVRPAAEPDEQVEPEPAEVAPVADAPEPVVAEEPVPVAAAAGAPVHTPAAVIPAGTPRGLAARRSPVVAPKAPAPVSAWRATGYAGPSLTPGQPVDVQRIAEAIVDKVRRGGHVPPGTQEFVSVAQATTAHGADRGWEKLTANAEENVPTITQVRQFALRQAQDAIQKALTGNPQSLVAAGAICTPLTPMYDFFRLAEPQNPVEQALPSINAARGGIRFITPVAVSAAAGAVGVTVPASSGQVDKPCLHIDCPGIEEATVEAISQCLEFDNLGYRIFPEQVKAFLEDVAVVYASRKEVFYLDFINAASTAVTGAAVYGASRGLLHDWELAAVAYRKRQGMRRGAPITALIPDWGLDAIKLDMALDGSLGLDYFNVTDAQVGAALASRGIVPAWYNDNPTGISPSQKFNGTQATGALNPFPTKLVAFLYAPGTFTRLDGGTLDVGLVRDSALNRTNDLQLFQEEWLGMAQLGFESVRLTSTFCVNGARPDFSTPISCS